VFDIPEPAGAPDLPLCEDPDDQKFLETRLACAARPAILGQPRERPLLKLARRVAGFGRFAVLRARCFPALGARIAAELSRGKPAPGGRSQRSRPKSRQTGRIASLCPIANPGLSKILQSRARRRGRLHLAQVLDAVVLLTLRNTRGRVYRRHPGHRAHRLRRGDPRERLVLTIGYLITGGGEHLAHHHAGVVVAGHALAYDQASGFGLVQPLWPFARAAARTRLFRRGGCGDAVYVIATAGARMRSRPG